MRLVIKAFNFITLIPLTLFCIFHLQLKKFWDISIYVYTMWNYFVKADNWTFFHTVGWFPYLLSFSCKINYVIGASQMAKRLKKKNPPANAGDTSLIPGSGRTPGEGKSNLLQYSCLGNPINRGAWQATVHGVAKSWLSDWTWAWGNSVLAVGLYLESMLLNTWNFFSFHFQDLCS